MKLAAKRKQMSMSPKQKADRSTASNTDARRGGGGHGSQTTAQQQGRASDFSGDRGKGDQRTKGKS